MRTKTAITLSPFFSQLAVTFSSLPPSRPLAFSFISLFLRSFFSSFRFAFFYVFFPLFRLVFLIYFIPVHFTISISFFILSFFFACFLSVSLPSPLFQIILPLCLSSSSNNRLPFSRPLSSSFYSSSFLSLPPPTQTGPFPFSSRLLSIPPLLLSLPPLFPPTSSLRSIVLCDRIVLILLVELN